MSSFRKVSLRRQLSNYVFITKIIWAHSKSLVAVYALKAITDGVSPVIQAFLVGALIGELAAFATGGGDETRAILYVLMSAFVQLLFFAVSSLERYMFVAQRELIEMEMRHELLQDRVAANLTYVEIPETKDKYERAGVGADEAIWYIRYTTDISASVISFLGVVGVLVSTIPWVLVVLLPLPLLNTKISLNDLLVHRSYWSDRRSHRIRANYINNLFERESGLLEIRMFSLGEKLLKLWRKSYKASVSISRNKESLAAKQDLTIKLVESGLGAAIDAWLVTQVFANVLTLGAFEQSRRLVSTYVLALDRFSSGFSNIFLYGYSVDDYRVFIEESSDYSRAHTGTVKLKQAPDKIEVVDLSFSYPTSDKKVINSASLTINRGEKVAIVGENGAGKTSLIKTLFGFYDPSAGAILYDGISHEDLDFNSLYAYTSSLMQDFVTFDFLTLGQSVALSFDDKYDRARVNKVLKQVGLLSELKDYPKGLDSNFGYVEDDGIKLSGGQAQRLAIARVLYRQDPVLVMDEPTSAIDAKSEQEIMDYIFDIYSDKTLVTISHRLSTVSRADKIIFMKRGKITEVGSHQELFKPGTDYYDLFHKQSMRIK